MLHNIIINFFNKNKKINNLDQFLISHANTDCTELHFYINNGKLIDIGQNAIVYKYKKYVYKIYMYDTYFMYDYNYLYKKFKITEQLKNKFNLLIKNIKYIDDRYLIYQILLRDVLLKKYLNNEIYSTNIIDIFFNKTYIFLLTKQLYIDKKHINNNFILHTFQKYNFKKYDSYYKLILKEKIYKYKLYDILRQITFEKQSIKNIYYNNSIILYDINDKNCTSYKNKLFLYDCSIFPINYNNINYNLIEQIYF